MYLQRIIQTNILVKGLQLKNATVHARAAYSVGNNPHMHSLTPSSASQHRQLPPSSSHKETTTRFQLIALAREKGIKHISLMPRRIKFIGPKERAKNKG